MSKVGVKKTAIVMILAVVVVAPLFLLVAVNVVLEMMAAKSKKDWERTCVVCLEHQIEEVSNGRQDSIYLYETVGTDALLSRLTHLVGLRGLMLELTDATDEGMKHVGNLPNLTGLRICGGCPGIGDRGIQHLSGLRNLEGLHLVNTRVTDQGLTVLAGVPNLREVALQDDGQSQGIGTDVDRAIENIVRIHSLRRLHLSGKWYSREAAEQLREKRPDVRLNPTDMEKDRDIPSDESVDRP